MISTRLIADHESPISAARIELMKQLEAKGAPRAEIGRIVGVDRKTALKYLGPKRHWVRSPRSKRPDGEYAKMMMDLRNRGLSPYKVALAIGCGYGSALNWAIGGIPTEKYAEPLRKLHESCR